MAIRNDRIVMMFWTDSYAPCMVQAQPKRPDLQRKFSAHLRANGVDEDTILLSFEDAAQCLSRRAYRDLENGWPVNVLVDRWEAFSMLGYDGGELA